MRRRLPFATAIAIALLAFAGCSRNGDDSDAVEFCVQGRDHQEMIVAPPIRTPDDIETALEFYRLMGELAPADISEQWHDLVVAMETASELVPGDQESEQLVAQTAYSVDRSAYEVMVWFRDYCGVDLPITTIVAHGPLGTDPVGATTPSTTSAP